MRIEKCKLLMLVGENFARVTGCGKGRNLLASGRLQWNMTMYRSRDQPCISTCCKQKNVYSPGSSCYGNVSLPTEAMNFSEIYDFNFSISSMTPKEFRPRYGIPCPGNTICHPDSNSTRNILIYLLDNGTIHMNKLIDGGQAYWLGTEDYCLTSHVTENGTRSVVSICESYFDSDLFLNAQLHYNTVYNDDMFHAITASLSLPFFVATFLVYTILSELKNLHGLILRTYVACCFVMYTMKLITYSGIRVSYGFIGRIINVYSLLATFFWLNVMCFDIWWSFRSLQHSLQERIRKKYILYSIYAWGVSALIMGYLIYDYHLQYLLGCVSATLVCNVFFFASAAIKIIRYKKSTARQLEGSVNSRHNDENQRFKIYLKLFIVMGTGWFFDIIGILWDDVPRYFLYAVEFPSIMQGLTIFILFVWNAKIKRLLSKRLGCKNRNVCSKNVM